MKKIFLILLLVSILLLFGCSEEISETSYNDLITSLNNMNFKVTVEDVEKSILQGQRKWLTIKDNENISIYIYKSDKEMEKDASYVSEDGCSYNNGNEAINISWVSYPHFFKKDNIIVLYVGDDLEVINALKKIMGSQFSGFLE